MSEDIKVTDGTVLEALNNKVDLDGGNYAGSPLEQYIHEHCGGSFDIGDIGIAPLGIDESLGKRRYLNGSVIIQDQYQVFTQKVKTAIQTYANLGCSEEEWQTISNMSVGGQCGKFVVDDTAGTIRLPKIIMPIQGLTDLTKLGEIVEAGLPDHSHNISTGPAQSWTGGSTATGYRSGYGTSSNWQVSLASEYNDIHGNSDTVQQEQIQYPYFIQVATGASVQDHIANKLELNNPAVLLEGKYFDAPVYNVSWLQANESYTGSLAFHPTAYNALLIEQNPNVLVGTTVDNYTKRGLSVKLNTEDYTDYDFVLNTTSQVFRCPLKINKASGKAVVGNGKALGLTDGTTEYVIGNSDHSTTSHMNLFSGIGSNVGAIVSGTSDTSGVHYAVGVSSDPTKSGIETSDDGLYLYFYVGETVQNANLVNVGRVEEKVASLIPDNSSVIASYAMPSNKYIDLTLGASGATYTAPASGYVAIAKRPSAANQYCYLENQTADFSFGGYATVSGYDTNIFLPVSKGDIFAVNYNMAGQTTYFKFIYAKGDK